MADRHQLQMMAELQDAGVPFFGTRVTRSQLEIPSRFARRYGDRMMFWRAMLRIAPPGSRRVWPVKIQITCSVRSWRVRFCSRWQAFVAANGLQIGDDLLVALVAKSEFMVYVFKKPLPSSSLPTDTSSQPSDSSRDDLPVDNAHTPKSGRSTELRARPTLRSSAPRAPTPAVNEEMQWEDASPDNYPARWPDVAREPESYRRDHNSRRQKVGVCSPRREHMRGGNLPKISESVFNGKTYFRKRLSESCVGHFGHPRYSRFEVRADFLRHREGFFSEGTAITLEGPTLGKSCEVVCHQYGVSNHRVMWKEGWPTFVKRNKLKKDDELKFTLVAPDRFLVELMHRERRPAEAVGDFLNLPFEDVFIPLSRKASNELFTESVNRNEDADLHKEEHFIKTLTKTSDIEHNDYPFLVIPASFWHKVQLPTEVNMLGPGVDEVFPVTCFGVDTESKTKRFTGGWKEFAYTNFLHAGDTLQFTFTEKSKLFKVEFV